MDTKEEEKTIPYIEFSLVFNMYIVMAPRRSKAGPCYAAQTMQ